MLNRAGTLTPGERGVTLSWEDGPRLARIGAQARYHTPHAASVQTLRISVTDPRTVRDSTLEARWVWRAEDAGWRVHLEVHNVGDAPIFLDALEPLRIDSAFGGALNLGAPSGLWRCARGDGAWECWSDNAAATGGFSRSGRMLMQPAASNRSHPPALLFVTHTSGGVGAPESSSCDFRVDLSGERFERFTALTRVDGLPLAPGEAACSPSVCLVVGDDAAELLNLR